jgi:hypothetical protein
MEKEKKKKKLTKRKVVNARGVGFVNFERELIHVIVCWLPVQKICSTFHINY